MDKELSKFINQQVNAVKVEVIISREKTSNGTEYIQISPKIDDDYKQMYSFWHTPNKQVRGPDEKPRGTGGKKAYLMVMIGEIENLRKKGVKNVEELIGCVMCLGNSIEWNTGKLINKRSKSPMQYKDLQSMFTFSNKKLNKIINELKEYDLLYKTKEGYFISTKYIKKGKTEREES